MILLYTLFFNSFIALNSNIDDIVCLGDNIFHESRALNYKESRSLSQTIFMRVENKKYWKNSICEVVAEPKQFSWYSYRNKINKKEIKYYYRSLKYATYFYIKYKFNMFKFDEKVTPFYWSCEYTKQKGKMNKVSISYGGHCWLNFKY